MYDTRPNLTIGFHGCDKSAVETLLNNPDNIKISRKPYDWLGHGMYFWENNYERALQWAKDKKQRGAIKIPAVIGATLNLGYCCDFLDSKYIKLLSPYYELMTLAYKQSNKVLPRNRDLGNDNQKDKILRELDCSVIEFMHNEILKQVRSDIQNKGFSEYKIFDSTRGMFTEGGPVFKGSAIFEKTHI